MFGLRRAVSSVRVVKRFGSHAADHHGHKAAASAHDPVFQSYHIGRSVNLKQVEGLFTLTKSTGKNVVSFTTGNVGSGFDIYGYGSIVFFNSPTSFHEETIQKIKSLELSPEDSANLIEGYNHECTATVGNPLDDPHLSDGEKEKLKGGAVVSVEKNRPAGLALAQAVALDYVDIALDRIIENISSLDQAGLNSAVKHLYGVLGSIEGRTVPKFDNPSNEIAYKEMRHKGGLDDLYKELDFKLAVLTRQYNITL